MALIFESANFRVEAEDEPLVDRADGGHIAIYPSNRYSTRQELPPLLAIELMRLTVVAGEAMTSVMRRNGVDIGRINYQDNGNWSVFKPGGPVLHVHLYGRATHAVYQKYGQSLYFPHKNEQPEFYNNCRPLSSKDISDIGDEMTSLFDNPRYSDSAWRLK